MNIKRQKKMQLKKQNNCHTQKVQNNKNLRQYCQNVIFSAFFLKELLWNETLIMVNYL